ncbi:MAG: YqgE/AlgH family protein [Pseudomonadota bacterium]
MTKAKRPLTSLKGQVLIAMPGMEDSRFHRTVIYVCEHSTQGTMGLVLNRPMQNMSFVDVLQQVNVLDDEDGVLLASAARDVTVYKGGPVETGRGFVLHTGDYHIDQATHRISDDVSLTETLEVLRALARGRGPAQAFLALGYAGWTGGQLENELQRNSWLNGPATPELLFSSNCETKYEAALGALGVDPALLSTSSGHA